MIDPQWLELTVSRTNINGPKDVRAIEVRLYTPDSFAYVTKRIECGNTSAMSKDIYGHGGSVS